MRLSRGIFIGALATFLLAAGVRAQPPLYPSFDLQTPTSPAVVRVGAEDQLVYELHLTNFSAHPLTLTRVAVLDQKGRNLATFAGSNLEPLLGRPGVAAPRVEVRTIQPGLGAVIYFNVPIHGPRPLRIDHRIEFDLAQEHLNVMGGASAVESHPAPVLGPPLRGGPWAAVYDPAMERGHRRVFYALEGRARLPGRFAVDWFKLDANGLMAPGQPTKVADYYGYGADVLAVADAKVAAIRDGLTVPTALKDAKTVSLATAAGNYIVLDLGAGRYAFYEHLQTGLKVKPGDHVRKGKVIAALGFSGEGTEPHLHLHVADGRDPLAAEGRPYAYNAFSIIGGYASIDKVGTERWSPASGPGASESAPALPAPNVVVMFPR